MDSTYYSKFNNKDAVYIYLKHRISQTPFSTSFVGVQDLWVFMFFSMVLVKKKLEIRSNSDRINNISTWITTSAWPLDRLQKRNASQGRYIHKDGFTIWQRMVGKPGWSSTSRCDTGDDHHSPPTSLTAILRLTSHPIVGGTSQREGEVMVRRGEGEVMVRRGGGETTCDSFRLYHEWDVT